MRIVVSEFVTLDGVMGDPGGSEKTPHGGWTWAYHGADIGKFKFDELFASDALLLGRLTYQGFAAAWPAMTDEQGFAKRMNDLPKYVVSRTLEKVEWSNSVLINEDLNRELSRLKERPGLDVLVQGSGQLVRFLMKNDLVDEYRLLVYPVVLGSGKRLFGEDAGSKLKLADTIKFGSGVLGLVYHPDRK